MYIYIYIYTYIIGHRSQGIHDSHTCMLCRWSNENVNFTYEITGRFPKSAKSLSPEKRVFILLILILNVAHSTPFLCY